ncbi:esterase [Rhodoferax sp.]|uniref:esterase n=1 Tax=Rhodoferax sp. TaxID=50421 RepID=UPI002ACD7804|nr:esterase [Rhodoferax sp.]MDZ7921361.1 esterase [Rhodoferax sp.]
MSESIVVQRPEGAPKQLMLLLHGVGATPQGLVPLGQRLAHEFPGALIVSVRAPHASDLGQGYQWFSVRGITEEDRPARVAEAMPAFVAMVHDWQRQSGVGPEATALIGFSQGAIMSLEATQRPELLAGRVVALSGRFAALPQAPHPHTTIHMLHGKNDAVIHYGYTVTGAEHLISLGADVTADVIPFLGHEINEGVVDTVMERLLGHLPKRHWEDVQRAAEAGEAPAE